MKQDNPGTPTVEDRSQEFKPVTGGPTETSSAEALLIAAYVLMWAVLMGFLFATFRRQAALSQRLGELERALAKRPPDS